MLDSTAISTSKRGAFHAQAYAAVCHKIARTYGMKAAEMAVPEPMQLPLQEGIAAQLTGKYWTRARDRAVAESGLAPDIMPRLDAVARATISRYLEVFHLRAILCPEEGDTTFKAADSFYNRHGTRKVLPNVLGNHVNNMSHYAFTDLGLNPESAHALQGTLIAGAIDVYRNTHPTGYANASSTLR